VFGDLDCEEKRPMERNTLFNIRSMTKPVTGVAVQMLIDEGKLQLDDPVSKFLPAFDTDKSRAITIRQLLTHRSGLPLSILSTKIDQYPDLQAQVKAIGEKGPQFKPGEKFWYSDAGSDTAAAIVEVVSGVPIDRFITERILKRVEMIDSYYPTKAEDPRRARIASLYLGKATAWNRIWSASGPPMYPFAWGSQTLYSTPSDYAKFLAMWLDGGTVDGKRILSAEAMKRILTPTSRMSMLGSDAKYLTGFRDLNTFYGQMAMLHASGDSPDKARVAAFGHSGSDGTAAWAFPEHDLIICYFTQSRGQLTPIRMEALIDRELLRAGQPRPPIAESLKPFLGTYYANFAHYKNAPFRVIAQDGRLALDIPDQLVFELTDTDKDGRRAFVKSDKVSIGFEKDRTGKVTALTLKQAGLTFNLPTTPAKQAALSREAVAKYLGKYRGEEPYGTVEVILKEGTLRVGAPDKGVELELAPRADQKSWEIRGNPGAVFTFQESKEGKVESLTAELPGGLKVVRMKIEN
jgi:CubicO group peptidase (beta-lactamase class C family)